LILLILFLGLFPQSVIDRVRPFLQIIPGGIG